MLFIVTVGLGAFVPYVKKKTMISRANRGDYVAMEWLVSYYTINNDEYEEGAHWARQLVHAGYDNYQGFCEWFDDGSSTNKSEGIGKRP
jgi:hypothetical protein